MSRILLVDVSYLSYRAFHTTGSLSYHGVKTGVAYGIIRELSTLIEWYQPRAVAFCFDSKESIRRTKYGDYKRNRRVHPEGKEAKLRDALVEQVVALRREHLPEMGFKNLFQRKGYEADDLIAHLAERVHFDEDAVIVAADKDLYQCLSQRVRMYNPVTKKEYTIDSFGKEYGVHPGSWARVKAIAGCPTDNIKGVVGVGDKTAAKYVAGKLKGDKTTLIEKSLKLISFNIELTALPLPGIPEDKYVVRNDRIAPKRWKRVCRSLGIKSVPFPETF